MVPDGTYSAASFSNSAATFSSRAVGNKITVVFRKSLGQRRTLRVLYISNPAKTVLINKCVEFEKRVLGLEKQIEGTVHFSPQGRLSL